MATKTNNLGLSKAELTDAVRSTLTANNGNFDTLDSTYQSMKEQINRLKANQIQGTASGTEIVVEDSAEMESTLHISGNSEQDSRSGKNLLKITQTTLTNNGVTVTTDELGTVKVNGTATDYSQVYFDSFQILENGDYTFSIILSQTQENAWVSIQESSDNSSWTNLVVINSQQLTKSEKVSLNTNKYYRIRVSADGGTIFSNSIIKMQLEKGAEATPYEPYGVQPSPDYPSEIRSVKSKSDNLFDKSKRPTAASGATFTSELETGVRVTATSETGSACWIRYVLGDISQYIGKTVRLKANFNASGDNAPAFVAGICNSDGTNVKQLSETARTSSKEISFVIPELTSPQTYLQVAFYATLDVGNVKDQYADFTNIMVTLDSEIKNYQPYGYVPVEAKAEGRNKIDITKAMVNVNGVEVSNEYLSIEDGRLTSRRTTNGYANYGFLVDVEPGEEYTFSTYIEKRGSYGGTGAGVVIGIQDLTNGVKLNSVDNWSTGRKSVSAIIPNNCKQIVCFFNNSGISNATLDVASVCSQIDLEIGSSFTKYTPHVSPKTISLPLGDIELRSTPDGTRDTFERVDGVWNVVSNIGSVVLDGSDDELWKTNSSHGSKTERYTSVKSDAKLGPLNRTGFLLSNHYPCIANNANYEYVNDSCVTIHPTNAEITIFDTRKLSLDDFESWLSSNPTEVIYHLAAPTYTPIADTALIQALDELESLILHKGYNRITVTGVNGVKAYLDLQYVKDINIVLDDIMTKLGGV